MQMLWELKVPSRYDNRLKKFLKDFHFQEANNVCYRYVNKKTILEKKSKFSKSFKISYEIQLELK
jgi:hypothetical protein